MTNKSRNKKSSVVKPDWIYGEKAVSHEDINNLVEADETIIPEMVYSDAIRRLKTVLEKVEGRKDNNLKDLQSLAEKKKMLMSQKKALQSEIDEIVQVNDEDRETIIQNTKMLDKVKVTAEQVRRAKKKAKPGEKLNIKSKAIFLTNLRPICERVQSD